MTEPRGDTTLIERQLDVLFARDSRGRLVSTRDPVPRPAPRVFLGRSREGNAWAIHRDLGRSRGAELARLLSAEPLLATAGVEHPPLCRAEVLEQLSPVGAEHRGPAYVLGDDLPSDPRARELSGGPSARVLQAFPWLENELPAVAPVAIAFDADEPAAICHSARGVSAVAAEAGVETLEPFRGRGLATAAVACWARAVQRAGRIALYSTSWENQASRALARRLSARLYGEDWHLS